MKKTGIFIIFALSFIFFSCASKPQPQLESDMQASSQNEALIESPAEPIAEPEVLEESDNTLEEIDEPDVRDLPPEEETFASEDDEIEDVESDEDQAGPDANSDADAALQANGTDAVVHQFLSQLTAGHTRITNGKVESVGHRLVAVLVINHVETVTTEDFLQFPGTLTIHFHLVAETILAVAGSTEHFSQCVLCRMTGS